MSPGDDSVILDGFREFVGDLKQVPKRAEAQMRTTLRSQARRIVVRAAGHTSDPGGPMATNTSIAVSPFRVRITWTEIYAGVVEFGKHWQRRSKGGGTHTVTMPGASLRTQKRGTSVGPPPRFAYRAWQQMQPTFADEVVDAIAEAAAAGGFWEIS